MLGRAECAFFWILWILRFTADFFFTLLKVYFAALLDENWSYAMCIQSVPISI